MLDKLFGRIESNDDINVRFIQSDIIKKPNDYKSLKEYFEDNTGKIFKLGTSNLDGWIIKNKGNTLIRIINGKESDLVISYVWSYSDYDDSYTYYMINGHIFILTVENNVFAIKTPRTSNMLYNKYNWVPESINF